MDTHIYIYIALSIFIVVLSLVTWNILRKYEVMMDQVLDSEDRIIELEKSISDTYNIMQEIDSKDIFETDDEVGQTFNQLRDVIKDLKGDDNWIL